jgi:hypothetical protein
VSKLIDMPAFLVSSGGVSTMGMTLRDYFAGQALAGYMANTNRPTRFNLDDDAKWMYDLADAMLAERTKA